MTSENQKALSLSSTKKLKPVQGGFGLITEKDEFGQNYIVHRINLPSLEVNEKVRNFIEMAMVEGKKFIRVGEHTVMVNAVSGIDPLPRKYKPLLPDEVRSPDGKTIFNKKTGKTRPVES